MKSIHVCKMRCTIINNGCKRRVTAVLYMSLLRSLGYTPVPESFIKHYSCAGGFLA